MKKWFVISVICFSLVTISSGVTAVNSTETSQKPLEGEYLKLSKDRAVSLNGLQEKFKSCAAKGKCSEEIRQLYGLKKILGYVIDENNRDIILFRKIDDSLPSLYLEDFVIALKNEWLFYAPLKDNTYIYSYPGCSIDPDPDVFNQLSLTSDKIFGTSNPKMVNANLEQWHKVCRLPQQVRVLGIPFDTRFAKIMVEADHYMKRLVDGSVTLDINQVFV